MKRWTIPITLTALLAGLALAATLAHAQPRGPPVGAETAAPVERGPPDTIPPVQPGAPDSVDQPSLGDLPASPDDAVDGQGPPAHAGPPVDVGPPAHADRPDDAGPGRAISEAARQKAKDVVGEAAVTNPAGHVVPLSLVGFCRSQAPWMSDKGGTCNELDAILEGLREVGDDTSEADGEEGAMQRGPPRQPGHRAARVGVEIARGLLQHVMGLVAQA
jgi:hypothetical protein